MAAFKFLSALLFCWSLWGCGNSVDQQLRQGLSLQSQGAYREATIELERVMKREPGTHRGLQAARANAKILLYDLKRFDAAIEALKYIVLYSKDHEERNKAQMQTAQIYFDNLGWYDRALIEYGKLLSTDLTKEEKLKVKLAMARCYYYLGQFEQSLREINEYETKTSSLGEGDFDILLLRANILLAQKNIAQAARSLVTLLTEFPERSKKENVPINLVLCYEELGYFQKAIDLLISLRKDYEPKDFIDLRIRKIQQRVQNQPKIRLKK